MKPRPLMLTCQQARNGARVSSDTEGPPLGGLVLCVGGPQGLYSGGAAVVVCRGLGAVRSQLHG